jgi:hypothetical protein
MSLRLAQRYSTPEQDRAVRKGSSPQRSSAHSSSVAICQREWSILLERVVRQLVEDSRKGGKRGELAQRGLQAITRSLTE